MVDAIQSSRFITPRKSAGLIRKIAALGSVHQAKQLNRHVFVDGQPKAINESIFYNVDAIHTAINSKKKISFKYFDFNVAEYTKMIFGLLHEFPNIITRQGN